MEMFPAEIKLIFYLRNAMNNFMALNHYNFNQFFYCPIRGMGEKPSPSGEDFSRFAVSWNITAKAPIPFTM